MAIHHFDVPVDIPHELRSKNQRFNRRPRLLRRGYICTYDSTSLEGRYQMPNGAPDCYHSLPIWNGIARLLCKSDCVLHSNYPANSSEASFEASFVGNLHTP